MMTAQERRAARRREQAARQAAGAQPTPLVVPAPPPPPPPLTVPVYGTALWAQYYGSMYAHSAPRYYYFDPARPQMCVAPY
jgi:hypothetical protein